MLHIIESVLWSWAGLLAFPWKIHYQSAFSRISGEYMTTIVKSLWRHSRTHQHTCIISRVLCVYGNNGRGGVVNLRDAVFRSEKSKLSFPLSHTPSRYMVACGPSGYPEKCTHRYWADIRKHRSDRGSVLGWVHQIVIAEQSISDFDHRAATAESPP